MRSVVTGAAGFIGSHLAQRLLDLGHEVVGVDRFSSYYNPAIKRRNVATLLSHERFRLFDRDIGQCDLAALLTGVDYVFHLAGQPGARASWGEHFAAHLYNNVTVTQQLLESAARHPLRKFVFASSSSVYGDAPEPFREGGKAQPVSPYGVTKLAAENLCYLYYTARGLPVVTLRYFTVYGPRQRPDMAIYRFIKAIAAGQPVTIYGDASQRRDLTYVDDIVDATVLAAETGAAGSTINVAGGLSITLAQLLALIQEEMGRTAYVIAEERQQGDALHTSGECELARHMLGFTAKVPLVDGLRRQIAWQLQQA